VVGEFKPSAGRHKISQARALYVLDHYVYSFAGFNDVTIYMGPDRGGVDLEVGTVTRDDITWIIHAMKIPKPLPVEYVEHLPR